MTIKTWFEDEKKGISCGINSEGELFIGNSTSGYNLPDTEDNREIIKADFRRLTK